MIVTIDSGTWWTANETRVMHRYPLRVETKDGWGAIELIGDTYFVAGDRDILLAWLPPGEGVTLDGCHGSQIEVTAAWLNSLPQSPDTLTLVVEG